MKIIYYLISVILLLVLVRCAEVPNWNDETKDSVPPGTVSNMKVENTNGGAIITYTLPTDADLMGVKAIYSFTEGGETRISYSSAFTNVIELEGFPDIKDRKVQLVAFDKSYNESSPVEVSIKPLTPPVELIRNSLHISETFNGVLVKWDNPTNADIGVSLYAEDDQKFMELDYTYYSRESGYYAFRGYENEERNFRVEVKDRWDNIAPPIDVTLTPLFEEDIVARNAGGALLWQRYGYADKTAVWRGDYVSVYKSNDFTKMFDGKNSTYFHPGQMADSYELSIFTENEEHKGIEPRPVGLTIDMTREAKLSRYKIYFRSGSFNANDPYYLVIWASNQPPKGPKDFDDDRMASLAYWTSWEQVGGTDAWKNDWTKVSECYVIPPSGATEQYLWTAEDLTFAQNNGMEYDFDAEHSDTPFRYLRIECFDNQKRTALVHFTEWEIYGVVVDK